MNVFVNAEATIITNKHLINRDPSKNMRGLKHVVINYGSDATAKLLFVICR